MKRQLLLDDTGFHLSVNQLKLSTLFQTIYHTQTGEPFGYEALLRASDRQGRVSEPYALLQGDRLSPKGRLKLDLTAAFLHLINFYCHRLGATGRLCVNLHPDTLSYMKNRNYVHNTFNNLVNRFKGGGGAFDYQGVVIEVMGVSGAGDIALTEQAKELQQHGLAIALDGFNLKPDNRVRLTQLAPNVVKLDKQLLQSFKQGDTQPLDNAVALAKDHQCLTVLEGVEFANDVVIARNKGIDLIQGFYLHKPAPQLREHPLDVDSMISNSKRAIGF